MSLLIANLRGIFWQNCMVSRCQLGKPLTGGLAKRNSLVH